MIIEALTAFAAATLPGPTDDYWYRDIPFLPGRGQTNVTPNTALALTAVFSCIRVRAETIAQLPLHLMQTDGRLRTKASDHPLYRVLHDQANHWQTAFDYRMQMQSHVDLRGNAYSLIVPGVTGAVDQLIPLHPDRMKVFRLRDVTDPPMIPDAGRLGYLYTDKQGNAFRLTQDEVLHLRGLSTEGVLGLSPIAVCRKAVQVGLEIEDHGLAFLTNAGKPSGALQMPDGKKLEAGGDRHKALTKSWRDAHTGKNLYDVAILEDGMTWQAMGLNNQELEWLESAKLSDRHIAAIFRVPLHLIMDWERMTYNNSENVDIQYVKHTVLPIARSWEGAISRDLITDPRYYPRFSVEGLLRGDAKSRQVFYRALFGIGVFSPNEIRELEDLNPVEGGDQRFVPLNMVPLDMASQIVKQPAEKKEVVDAMVAHEKAAWDRHVELATVIEQRDTEAKEERAAIVANQDGHATATVRHRDKAVDVLVDVVTSSEERVIAETRVGREQVAALAEKAAADRHVLTRDRLMMMEERIIEVAAMPDDKRREVIAYWITDAATRLAAAEIAELTKRADKAADDPGKFDTWAQRFWTGKQRDYIARTLDPIVRAEPDAKTTAEDMAVLLSERAQLEFTKLPPVELLADWREHRAERLTKTIMEELYHE